MHRVPLLATMQVVDAKLATLATRRLPGPALAPLAVRVLACLLWPRHGGHGAMIATTRPARP